MGSQQFTVDGEPKTILLVEDDEEVRKLILLVLSHRGYCLLSASNGHDALRVAEQRPGPIDLLLTDVVLPRMNGYDLARRLRTRQPDIRVLYMSGYVTGASLERCQEDPNASFIDKPFTPDAIRGTVAETIQGVKANAMTAWVSFANVRRGRN